MPVKVISLDEPRSMDNGTMVCEGSVVVFCSVFSCLLLFVVFLFVVVVAGCLLLLFVCLLLFVRRYSKVSTTE